MNQTEDESNREKEIIINFAKRLDNILTEASKSDDFKDEDGAFFKIEDLIGITKLVCLRKVYEK